MNHSRSMFLVSLLVASVLPTLAACGDAQLANSSDTQEIGIRETQPVNSNAPQPAISNDKNRPPLVCDAGLYDVLGGVDLQTATVLDVQQALDRKAFTSVDLVEHQLALIEAFDRSGPALNAIRALAPTALEQAREADKRRKKGETRGSLDGVTVLLKDLINTTDMPTTAGSIAMATNVPLREATITRLLREAGAIVLGKTNMSEWANWMATGAMPSGYSSIGGQVLAPYRTGLDPSGSSTGSGVAATMGFATATVGTETLGSIIEPAARHSLVGVKPTVGLVSRTGVIPIAPSWDTPGPMARTVTDAAALLGVLAHADPEDPASARFINALGGEVPDYVAGLSLTALQGVRLGVRDLETSAYGQALDYSRPAYAAALAVLQAEGAQLVAISDVFLGAEYVPLGGEVAALANAFKMSINRYLAEESGPDTFVNTLTEVIEYNKQHPDKVKYGQHNLQLSDAQSGSELDPVYLASREAAIRSSQAWLDSVMTFYDLDAIVSWNLGQSNVNVTAAAGYPNITVPLGYDNQLPLGLQIAGRQFDEAKLLAYAYDFEQASLARRAPPLINPELLNGCKQ